MGALLTPNRLVGTLVKDGFRLRDAIVFRRAMAGGLQIGENFICAGMPHFGSQPYLISIGNNVSLAWGVRFITHDGTATHLRRLGLIDWKPAMGRITVHDESGIGAGALILQGVTIGPRSIVGAGAVVRKDVPPNTVVFGNPARFAMTFDDLVESFRERPDVYDRGAYELNPAAEALRHHPRPW